MDEFFALLTKLLLITCAQMFTEMFIDADKRPYLSKIANVACYAAGVYFVVDFVFQKMMTEVISVFNTVF